MADIVTKLRVTADVAPEASRITRLIPGSRDLLREAADEIERLRANEMFLRDCLADRGLSATKRLSN